MEEHAFGQACAKIEPDARRMDDMLDGIKNIVCHAPRMGERVSDSGDEPVWALGTDTFPDAPRIVVYYTLDDERGQVHLKHVVLGETETGS